MDLYHYWVVVYTHCQDTFQFKQHVKVNFASDDPFKCKCSAVPGELLSKFTEDGYVKQMSKRRPIRLQTMHYGKSCTEVIS